MKADTQSDTSSKRSKLAVPRILVAGAVTDRLRSMILSGQLPDGTPLRQDALAEEMSTSRIPVREALSRLESEGLVASFPHKGYVVTALSRAEIEELFDLRCLLEPELIRFAIPRLDKKDFETVEAIQREFDVALSVRDTNSWGELNRRYHMALYSASGRGRTLEIVRNLLVNADRYTRLILTVTDGAIHAAKQDHDSLLDLCRKRLVNQAVALTRDHINRTGDELLRMLDGR